MKNSIILILLIFLSSCCAQRKTITTEQEIKTEIVVKDCTIIIPADTVSLMLRYADLCDSTWRATLKNQPVEKRGKRATVLVEATEHGIIINCNEDSLIEIIEGLRKETITATKTKVETKQENRTNRLLLFAIILVALAFIIGFLRGK